MKVFDVSETKQQSVAVLLPCYNEEVTIAQLVADFKEALPGADIYVYDNASSDKTAERAKEAGAIVRHERRRGKGNVIRRMFSDIDADVYVMADGDGTYAAKDAPALIEQLNDHSLAMVVGRRANITEDAGRKGHALGNRVFNATFRWMFEPGFSDIFSGYRVFSRRFVKSFPALSAGFETETEISVHALTLKLPVEEQEVSYSTRPEGSESKLSTFKDGLRILKSFFILMKEVRPLQFFSILGGISLLFSLYFGLPVVFEYFTTGIVTLIPRWIACIGMLVLALMMFVCGIILDSIARFRTEQKLIAYLATAKSS
ncbi:glycosyltransferase [Sulfitobacter sp. 1151]|uniref:Glycosyltransferase n=1 Tax=Parasulfitobacter algicola TaxID=2614809 RepID=A0ABX2IZ08_9RHOB|nr:glycosyltransferase [Sulfitobacter algicola]NSX56575.1 glycosyltransferase [Sulfitobacter algicola]